MQRFKIFVSGLLALLVLTIMVFGPRPGANRPKNRVVVTYWEKWTGREAEQMKEIVDDFNVGPGAKQGIYVEYLSMSSVNQKTLVSTAAGIPPDVAGLWGTQVAQFAAENALQPLDEMAREHGITRDYYKPVYWKGCSYQGRLYSLISTPAAVALFYNKKIFKDNADKLRAAGLDPNSPPKTLDEMDRYAKVLDKRDAQGHLVRSGYLPMEPGWYLPYTAYWFGADIFDPKTQKFTLTDPKVIKAYNWIRSYSLKLGKDAISDFRSSLGGFDSPSNPFMVDQLAMEQQGPWMSNYIDHQKPSMNRWITGKDENAKQDELKNWTTEKRRANYEWGAAVFPPASTGEYGVTMCPFDMLSIPRGARHPKEAFEFIAFVNSQKEMEKLCMLHCKNSPLSHVSQNFLQHHPNPYIQVFEDLASNPHAKTEPSLPIWPEVNDELSNVAQQVYLLQDTPEHALRDAQTRLQARYDDFRALQEGRASKGKS